MRWRAIFDGEGARVIGAAQRADAFHGSLRDRGALKVGRCLWAARVSLELEVAVFALHDCRAGRERLSTVHTFITHVRKCRCDTDAL